MTRFHRTHPGRRLRASGWAALTAAVSALAFPARAAEPIKALLIAGGCCHDYPNQNNLIPEGVSARANVQFTAALQVDADRGVKIPLYSNPHWAEGYDVVIHNECFGGVNDAAWLERVAAVHAAGVPAVFIHCSLHSYRAAPTDAWRELIGLTSRSHEGKRPVRAVNLAPKDPIMIGFPDEWLTPNGELYKIEKVWPNTTPLAQAWGVDTRKNHVCVWKNEYGGARVFGTSLGHHNETIRSPVYLDLLTRGLLWTVGKLGSDGRPIAGYGAVERPSSQRRVLAADYQSDRAAIVAPNGRVLWEHPIKNIHDLQYLPNGNVLFQTDWTRIVEMTPDKRIVWEYDAATSNGNRGRRVEVHAFQRLDSGLTMIAESGPARIIEVDHAGRLRKDIPMLVRRPHPHRDSRLARKLPNGNYLVAHEGDGAVREYTSSGMVVWEHEVGDAVYSAIRLRNGNTLIGCGDGSRVIEVSRQGETVWSLEQNELPGIRLAWVTNVAELPNGNRLVGNCHAGPANPQIIEITPDKEVVWTFRNFAAFANATPISQVLDVKGTVIR